jgi:hypothetical protein
MNESKAPQNWKSTVVATLPIFQVQPNLGLYKSIDQKNLIGDKKIHHLSKRKLTSLSLSRDTL